MVFFAAKSAIETADFAVYALLTNCTFTPMLLRQKINGIIGHEYGLVFGLCLLMRLPAQLPALGAF
jgi:hypothetical protein